MAGTRIRCILLDVNETLSDMGPMGSAFAAEGLPEALARTWFAGTLRDGIALAACGEAAPFADVARSGLATLGLDDAASDRILDRMSRLDVHPDVVDGLHRLVDAGLTLCTLSNGSASIAEDLLDRAGVRDLVAHVLSVEQGGTVWKPGAASYEWAAAQTACDFDELLLVAAHPWDVHGAKNAGLDGAWLNRAGTPYPDVFAAPDYEVADLRDLAEALSGSELSETE